MRIYWTVEQRPRAVQQRILRKSDPTTKKNPLFRWRVERSQPRRDCRWTIYTMEEFLLRRVHDTKWHQTAGGMASTVVSF